MRRIIISVLIVVLGLALSSCESSTDDSPGPLEYDNSQATTPEGIQYSNEHIQYSNEHVETTLPETGGIKVW